MEMVKVGEEMTMVRGRMAMKEEKEEKEAETMMVLDATEIVVVKSSDSSCNPQ